MIARAVLGYVLALPALVALLINLVSDPRTAAIAVTMASSTPGHLQVFFDSGAGFREVESGTAWLDTTGAAREYRIRLPPGSYRQLRIDPGTAAGRYDISRVEVLASDGSRIDTIALTSLTPAQQRTIVDVRTDHLGL